MAYKIFKKKYKMLDFEYHFMIKFESTHSFVKALSFLSEDEQLLVRDKLGRGNSNLAKAYNEFILSAPIHPEANKVTILDDLIWIKNQSREDKDTMGVIRAIQEINKMIKGNLVSTKDAKVSATELIALYDLTPKKALPEPKVIDAEEIKIIDI